jgi:hypothetical protein
MTDSKRQEPELIGCHSKYKGWRRATFKQATIPLEINKLSLAGL